MDIRQRSSVSPIDAVITWVDGSDPAHQAKLDAQIGNDKGRRPAGGGAVRFHDSGEINYCVLSLLKFAPWLRTIFILTDAQTPSICSLLARTNYNNKVRVVDHRDVFRSYEEYLPTFNSRSITTMLYRIPGLAENFLYLNDDFMLIQPTWPEYFFQADKVVVRGYWRTFSDRQIRRKLVDTITRRFSDPASAMEKRPSFVKAVELAAKLVGFRETFYNLFHNPHSWKKSIVEEFYQANPEVLHANASYKLRSEGQFTGESLMAHLAIKQQRAILDNRLKTLQLKPGEQTAFKTIAKLAAADADSDFVFACVQSLETAPSKLQSRILEWLEGRIGYLEFLGTHQHETGDRRLAA